LAGSRALDHGSDKSSPAIGAAAFFSVPGGRRTEEMRMLSRKNGQRRIAPLALKCES